MKRCIAFRLIAAGSRGTVPHCHVPSPQTDPLHKGRTVSSSPGVSVCQQTKQGACIKANIRLYELPDYLHTADVFCVTRHALNTVL